MSLVERLRLPEARRTDLDDPAATLAHARIIRQKPFLRRLYRDWYRMLAGAIRAKGPNRVVVELGSGGGFMRETIPDVITSDVLPLADVDMQFSALEMPLSADAVDAVVMLDVMHHVPDAERFLAELDRVLRPGGQALMIEPANTPWGRFVYRNFHHEPFEPRAGWRLPPGGPMSAANGALPWIVFARDRRRRECDFPRLRLARFQPHTPLRYLASGGVSLRSLAPGWMFGPLSALERLASPLARWTGMFYLIELVKHED